MQAPVYSLTGEVIREIEIRDDVFAVPFNEPVVQQAVVRHEANTRQGTAATKTRGEVSGSGIKLHPQKHTGRARAGDSRSPTRRKGGVTFGPQPRDYHQAMPRKMRRLALRCALSAKAGDGELKIVEKFEFEKPATKEMAKVITALGAAASALVVTVAPEENVVLSARNLPGVKTMPANLLNVSDILTHRILLMTEPAVRKAEELWGQQAPQGDSDASV